MARAELVGWASTQRVGEDGTVETEQRVTLADRVVEPTENGAQELAARYWVALRRFGRGLFAVREHAAGVDVRLLGLGPRLLELGALETQVIPGTTGAGHPIVGGLLVRRRGGRISFEQVEGEAVELRSRINGFHPRRGPFYGLVQRKLHVAVSRRYFRSLAA